MADFALRVRVDSRVPAVRAALRRELGTVVRATVFRIEAAAKASMAEPKSGRIYRRRLPGGGVVFHQASAPSEAPAIDLGTLVNSIQSMPEGPLTWALLVGAEHGSHQEFGTRNMEARPFVGPAATGAEPGFVAAAAMAVRRAAAVGEVRGA